MKKILNLSFLLPLLIGCQIKLDSYDPSQGKEQLVVDGFVSDSLGFHFVRLTKSTSILSTDSIPVVSNATVVVSDGVSLVDTFYLAEPRQGLYLPSKIWKGIPGNTYTLTIKSPDFEASAVETMPSYETFKIDSLKSVFREKATEQRVRFFAYNDIFFNGRPYIAVGDSVFRVRIFALNQLPYRVNIEIFAFRNGLPYQSSNRYFVRNVQEIPLNNFFIFPPGAGGPPENLHFLSGDTVTVQLHGISDGCYVYYQGLNDVFNNDGGLFSAPAGNPPNNFNNPNILGYFRAARVTQKNIIVKFSGEVDK
jgi:hypothetical protein